MRALTSAIIILTASPALSQPFDQINSLTYQGGALPNGQSALTVKLQVLLDRSGISPGVIDGYKGGMSESALRGFEAREGLSVDGVLDPQVWAALGGDSAPPVLVDYVITNKDISDLTDSIPDNVADKAQLDNLGYTSVSERLSERFHMDEDFMKLLNPETTFQEGDTILVAETGSRLDAEVTRIEIRKSKQRAVTFDVDGTIISDYPVSIGSAETPSPQGTVTVNAVAMNPTYSYRPDVNFEADGVTEALTLPPGANGPVGSVWIDLSKPTYGLHGTDTPAALFKNESHGCVRFTNWDVEELAYMVSPGVEVEFVE